MPRAAVPACEPFIAWTAGGNVVQDYYQPIDRHYVYLVEIGHFTGEHGEKGFEGLWGKQHWKYIWGDMKYVLNKIPNHPGALRRLIGFDKIYHELSYDDIIQRFECAIQWNKKIPDTYVIYGVHLHRSGKINEAILQYEQAIKLRPKYAEAHYNLGLAYVASGEIAKAEHHARIAYELGFPLPGLKNKLKRIEENNETAPPVAPAK